uniref:Basigin n=1 Tax=Sinocyclocheilus grahami TaxID=75366 RepID=A0A672L922_SINGR
VLDCEVIGNPIPEVQWWFIEGEEPIETVTQLFDGAREDSVHINATYINHATSTLILTNLTLNDTGVYECRASNDPDRNDLRTPPKVKWIRSQANIIVFEHAAITTKPEVVNDQNQTSATLSCNLTNPFSPIKGYYWTHNGKTIDKSESTTGKAFIEHEIKKIDYHSAGLYACVFQTEPEVNATIEVKVIPHVVAYKHSENANEKDKAVLICVSHGYPLPTDWSWYKLSEDDSEKVNKACCNNMRLVPGVYYRKWVLLESEFVNPRKWKLSVFGSNKRQNLNLSLSYHSNLLCEPNLVRSRFSSVNPEFLSVSSPFLKRK